MHQIRSVFSLSYTMREMENQHIEFSIKYASYYWEYFTDNVRYTINSTRVHIHIPFEKNIIV